MALSDAGYRAIAPDLRGYGETEVASSVKSEYSMKHITADLLALLDALSISSAVFIGHDWGGAVVWYMALHYPTRVAAVASLNTPFPRISSTNPLTRMKENPGVFDYQLYFQDEGVAEQELEKDIEYTFKCLMRASDEGFGKKGTLNTSNVRKRGGLLAGFPPSQEVRRSRMLTEEDLSYYVQQYTHSTFRGPLNWYRNIEENWKWCLPMKDAKIHLPALMITAGKDPVLSPSLTVGMEKFIPNLRREHIEDCGHWTQQEQPDIVNVILIQWLKTLNLHQPSRL